VVNKLLLFFIVLPLVELCLMLLLGNCLMYLFGSLSGIALTILFIIGTGLLGTWLARTQGVSTYQRIQQELSQGRMPTNSLVDGALILLAGVLLISPGVLTDLVGILLMIPLTRVFFRRQLIAWFQRNFKIQTLTSGGPRASGDGVVDSYATESPSDSIEPRRVS
jgi:UPF0716 protein FxsA